MKLRHVYGCVEDVSSMIVVNKTASNRLHMSQDSRAARRSTLCSLAKALGAPGEPVDPQMAPADILGRRVCEGLTDL